MLITFLVFAAIIITVLSVALFILFPKKRIVSTVPGLDPTDDVTGNVLDIQDAGSFYEFLVQLHRDYGSVASFWLRDKFCVSVSSAAAFKDVQHLFDRPEIIFEFALPLIGQKSIQIANGETARAKHKIYSEALGHAVCCRFLPKFSKIAKDLVQALGKLPEDEHIPVHAYMMAIAIKIISSTQFGAFFKNDDAIRKFHLQYEAVIESLDKSFLGALSEDDPKYKELQENIENFKSTVKQMIKVHKKAREEGDYEEAPLLNAILDNAADDEEAVADVITFIIGGFHTTGNFLTWMVYYLSLCPEVQKKMIVEIDSVLKGGDLDETKASQLPYVWQVMHETLRIGIPGPFAARLTPDHEIRIQGHVIPPRTAVLVALGVSMNDEKKFPDPGKFDPDRFSPEATKKRSSLEYTPFGLGQRRCPGYKFSRFEALSVIVTLLQNFSFKPAFDDDFFVKPYFGTVVTKPETEIWIKVKSRNKH